MAIVKSQMADADNPTGAPEPGEGTPQEEAEDAKEQAQPKAKANGKAKSGGNKLYDLLMASCLQLIFGKQSFPMVCQKLVSSGMPIPRIIGHTAAMVLLSVLRGLQQHGQQVPQQLITQAAREIIGNLIQIALGLKLFPMAQAKSVANAALMYAVQDGQNWLHQTGNVSPAQQQAAGLRLSQQGYQTPQQAQQQQPGPGAPPPQGGIVGSAQPQPPQQ